MATAPYLFAGSDQPLARLLAHYAGASPAATVTSETAVVALHTWADVLRGVSADDVVARIETLQRAAGPGAPLPTVVLVPFSSTVSEHGSSHGWLRGAGADPAPDPVNECILACQRRGLESHIVLAPMLLAPRVHEVGEYPSFLNRVLGIARALAREAADKAATYLEQYPLQLIGVGDGEPTAITPQQLAICLAAVANDGATLLEPVTVRCVVPWSRYGDAVRDSAGFRLALVDDAAATTSLDRLLTALVADYPGLRLDSYASPARVVDVAPIAEQWRAAVADVCAAPLLSWESTYLSTHEYDVGRVLASDPPAAGLRGDDDSCPQYFEAGDGPALLLVAPIAIDVGYFGNLIADLVADRRVIVWAEQAGPDEGTRRRAAHHQLLDVLRRCELAACDVVAWCSGVHVVDRLLAEEPSRVRSITLLCPDLEGSCDPLPEYRGLLDLFTLMARTPDCAGLILSRAKSIIRMAVASDPDQYRRPGTATSPLQYRSAALARRAMRVFEDASHVLWWAREFLAMTADTSIGGGLRRYPGPILCVLGTADSLMGYERLRAYCGGLPRVTIATVKGGSHYLVTEHAPLVARLIREFVDHGGLVATRSPRVDAGRLQILPPSADERIAATLSPLATS